MINTRAARDCSTVKRSPDTFLSDKTGAFGPTFLMDQEDGPVIALFVRGELTFVSVAANINNDF
jgi:hypothetical protein